MEQIKRQLINDVNSDHDNKRPKIQISTEQSDCSSVQTISHFEDLSNELLYEIFDYLDYFHVYQAFYNLNQRFRNTLTHSKLPIKINLSSMSKSAFNRYNEDIIKTVANRIISLRVSNAFVYEYVLFSIPKLTKFRQLQTLILDNIEAKYLEYLLDQLRSLSLLSSLVLTCVDSNANKNDIYRQVFRLPSLKYCKLFLGLDTKVTLAVCTDEYSPIEHLVIMNGICRDHLNSLLSYVPHLRRLSIKTLTEPWLEQENVSPNLLKHLTHFSLKSCSLSFDYLARLLTDFFQTVQVLHLTIENCYRQRTYLDSNKWVELITNHLVNLRIFDIRIKCFIRRTDDQSTILAQIQQFTSSFWIERQWFFTHHIYPSGYGNYLLFYSTNPYKRKYYSLNQTSTRNETLDEYQPSFNSVEHINIRSGQNIISCNQYFPNATQLTLSDILPATDTSITMTLNHIVPLQQLTKLVIKCYHFSFRKFIRILYYTPKIDTIELKTIICYDTTNDYTSIKQSEEFQYVSQTNFIRNVTCEVECTIEQIRLLIRLCPRMYYLTTSSSTDDLELIVRFLLKKNNPNTQHLYSLRFTNDSKNVFDRINILIKAKNLLDDYTITKINQDFYVWW